MIFADAAAVWSPGPLYVALEPYILTAFGALVSAFIAWACVLLQRYTGVRISQNARDQVQTAAMNAAGRIMAAQDTRFANMRVTINSPLIADEIPVVTSVVQGAVKQLNLTPERVGALIQGKVGQLQAQAQSIAPAQVEALGKAPTK